MPSSPQAAETWPLTLVVSFIDIGGVIGKRPQDYDAWMANLVPHVRWPLVVFGDPVSLEKIKRLRGGKPAEYVPVRVEDLYSYRHLESFQRRTRNEHGDDDPQTLAMLFLIQCEKPFFLERAANMNPFNSPLLFWCDIAALRPNRLCGERGLFRLSDDLEWPNLEICRNTFPGKISLIGKRMPRRILRPREAKKYHTVWVGGLFFGGAVERVSEFVETYRRALDARAATDHRLMTDEPLLRDAYAARPDLAQVIRIDRIGWLKCLTFPRPPLQFWWYLLSGRRFPWRYFRRRLTPAALWTIVVTGIRLRIGRIFRR